MELLGTALTVIGGIIMFIGGIWMLIEQFRSGILWGLACMFIPFVALIWLILHWQEGRRPFATSLGGMAVFVVGMFLSGEI